MKTLGFKNCTGYLESGKFGLAHIEYKAFYAIKSPVDCKRMVVRLESPWMWNKGNKEMKVTK